MIYLSGLFDFHESDHLSISTGRPQLLLNSAALVRLGAPAIYLRSEKRWFKIPIISVHFRVGSVTTGTRTQAERRRTHGGEKDKEVQTILCGHQEGVAKARAGAGEAAEGA